MAKIMQLSRLTSLDLGGTPLRYFRPRAAAELRAALAECCREGIPWRVLGGGSNLLIDDGPLPYAVVHVTGAAFGRIARTGLRTVTAGAGAATARLLATCKENGLGGLEFLAGLPGTVGGAVAGNAGAWGRQVSDPLSRLRLMRPDGRTLSVPAREVDFSYRSADLNGCIVMEAEFALEPRDRRLIARQMDTYARARAERHPLGGHSAGCIFKNPPRASAGRLLDLCGLKGRRIGGAQVSHKHANFILNRGGATAGDVLALIAVMEQAVRLRFGIQLELEVRHWPAQERAA